MPTADFVIAALLNAARHHARDLAALLARLAESIRDEVDMRVEIDANRAGIRTEVKGVIIVAREFDRRGDAVRQRVRRRLRLAHRSAGDGPHPGHVRRWLLGACCGWPSSRSRSVSISAAPTIEVVVGE